MKPRHYIDLQAPERGLGGKPLPIWAGQLLQVLHGLFRQQLGCYALALPARRHPFLCLRIFAETREALDGLADVLDGKPGLPVRIGRIRSVPEPFAGPWLSYRRYRIPTRKSERRPDGTVRQRRIQSADQEELPYFQLRSQSNGAHFGLRVQILLGNGDGPTCEPDSYGLALASRPFSLPDLPFTPV